MWVNYKGVMVLVGVGRNASYKIINQLNDELAKKGYLVNPHHKVPMLLLTAGRLLNTRSAIREVRAYA